MLMNSDIKNEIIVYNPIIQTPESIKSTDKIIDFFDSYFSHRKALFLIHFIIFSFACFFSLCLSEYCYSLYYLCSQAFYQHKYVIISIFAVSSLMGISVWGIAASYGINIFSAMAAGIFLHHVTEVNVSIYTTICKTAIVSIVSFIFIIYAIEINRASIVYVSNNTSHKRKYFSFYLATNFLLIFILAHLLLN